MTNFIAILKEQASDLQVREYEALVSHTSFRSGGAARYFAAVESLDQLIKLVQLAQKQNIPVRIIGGGSNVLIAQEGFAGLVIKNNCRRFELQGMKGTVIDNKVSLSQVFLYAEAGAITNQVVRFVVDQGFGGLELALGLPGTIGGAVCVNANFPKEKRLIGESVFAAKIMNDSGEVIDIDEHYFRFGFDTSRLLQERAILLSILFRLHPEDKKTLWEKAEAAVYYRTETMPKNITTGMTFRNIAIKRIYPNASIPEDIPPSELLEKAGLKGYKVGGVQLAIENPSYLINCGNGNETDVIKLLSDIKETIFRKFGVQLEMQSHILR